ncbi:MAG: hypothetical protein HC769_26550 [Cyanobacteria bacterium CRU_2_1]|nr:hypothetical protein [Cyanobacteria bacterium RU_5_0]NJR62072.1 hypothetical protein [Cyanobacteria bacterium CRU_2_1]
MATSLVILYELTYKKTIAPIQCENDRLRRRSPLQHCIEGMRAIAL